MFYWTYENYGHGMSEQGEYQGVDARPLHERIFDQSAAPPFYTSEDEARRDLERMMEADLANPKYDDSFLDLNYRVVPLGGDCFAIRRIGYR